MERRAEFAVGSSLAAPPAGGLGAGDQRRGDQRRAGAAAADDGAARPRQPRPARGSSRGRSGAAGCCCSASSRSTTTTSAWSGSSRGRGFLERSTMLSQRLWEHERTIEPARGRRLHRRRPARLGAAAAAAGRAAAPADRRLLPPPPRAAAAPLRRRASGSRLAPCPSPTTSSSVLDALPPDWTDLELDLRIDDESQYVDSRGRR